MNVDLTEREMTLIKMASDEQVLLFDARLQALPNGGEYKRAHTMRNEFKVLASRMGILRKGSYL